MNKDGEIIAPENVKKHQDALREELVQIEHEDLAKVARMNRHDRRAWYAQKRREERRSERARGER